MEECKGCVADVLGACQGDFCRLERDALVENAQRLATLQGHVLGEFVKSEGCPVWQAVCARCGNTAIINIDPVPGEADLSGEALFAPCSRGLASPGSSGLRG